jgi:hypothetical protein
MGFEFTDILETKEFCGAVMRVLPCPQSSSTTLPALNS